MLNIINIVKEIKETIKNGEYFIVRLPSIIGFITGILLIINKKKYYVEVVGCGKEGFLLRGDVLSKLIAYPAFYIQKLIVKKSTVTTYITEKYLQDLYPTTGISIGSVSNVNFKFTQENNEFIKSKKKSFANKDNRFSIGLVGSLDVKYKGHDTALKTLQQLINRGYNFHLNFVGPGNKGNWDSTISKMGLENHVSFLGVLSSGEEIYDWYKKMDFYIQPSLTEGHGRALVEAIYHGCISFGSNVGGIPDTLSEEFTFEKTDYKALTELILYSINNREFGTYNIEKNYENIKKYSVETIEKRRIEALNSYVKGGVFK